MGLRGCFQVISDGTVSYENGIGFKCQITVRFGFAVLKQVHKKSVVGLSLNTVLAEFYFRTSQSHTGHMQIAVYEVDRF